MKLEVLAVIIFAYSHSVYAIIGYDCTVPETNITAVSVSSVAACAAPATTPKESKIVIQLVQQKQYDRISYISCLVERTSIIMYCGMHSHMSAYEDGFRMNEIIQVPEATCQIMQDHGTYAGRFGHMIVGIKRNATMSQPLVEAGSLEGSSCKGDSFAMGGKWYKNAVIQSVYSIKLTSGMLPLDIEGGTVIMPSGVTAPLRDEAVFDYDMGYTYWSLVAKPDACGNTAYNVIYQGDAYIFKGGNGAETLVVNTSSHALAVGLTTRTLVCHQLARATDHPRLFIILTDPERPLFYFKNIDPLDSLNIDLSLYTNSKVVYLEKHLSRELIRVYRLFNQKVCDINHQMLSQLISLAYIRPDEFAWAYTKKPGMTAVVRGEVVYILQCPAVSVAVRQPEKRCYQELAVMHNGTEKFLKPRSRIIVDYGTEVECNPLAPSLYKVNGKWMRIHPEPTEVLPPLELTASSGTEWEYAEPPHLLRAGIYTSSEMSAYQKRLIFPIERPAIDNIVARALINEGVDRQGIDGLYLLQKDALEKAQEGFMRKLYGWYWNVTLHFASFTGFFLILYLIKNTADTVINGTLLYKTFGWSLKLLSAVWGTVAKHLIITNTMMKQKQEDDSHQLVEVTSHTVHPHTDVRRNLSTAPSSPVDPSMSDIPLPPPLSRR